MTTAKSDIEMHYQARWDIDRILEKDLDPLTMVGMARMQQTPRSRDPATGEMVYEETALLRRGLKTRATYMGSEIDSASLLRAVRDDFTHDVLGNRPLSGFNYIRTAYRMMKDFGMIERILAKTKHEAYLAIYEGRLANASRLVKRVELTKKILRMDDSLTLHALAYGFDQWSPPFQDFCYYDLDLIREVFGFEKTRERARKEAREGNGSQIMALAGCSIM
ncbi:hypothetical protein OQA88_13464 [Cercophora sp. LCS_1]